MKKHTSIIWKIPKEVLQPLVKKSNTISEILKYFGLENKGANYKTLHNRLIVDKINFSHIPRGLGSNKGKKFNKTKIPLEQVLIKNSKYARYNLKKRLISEGRIIQKCAICGLGTIWNNKKISLQLDHKNGIANDNRLKNLRFLCPNCHSQTDTFAGKGLKKWYWCSCGKEISKKSKKCTKCANKITARKIRKVKCRPTKETLLELVKKVGYCEVGRRYGVSDNAIRKWLKFEE